MSDSIGVPHFRFLDLPPELRLLIYRKVLVQEDHPVRMCNPVEPFALEFQEDAIKIEVNLLRVSRQIHNEAAKVLYGGNVFFTTPRLKLVVEHPDEWHRCELCASGGDSRCRNPGDIMDRMGSRNRAAIRAVEMLIPPRICPDHVKSMLKWLPNLDRLYLVFPGDRANIKTFGYDPGMVEKFMHFCERIVSALPAAKFTGFDFSVFPVEKLRSPLDQFDVVPGIRNAFRSAYPGELPLIKSQESEYLILEIHAQIEEMILSQQEQDDLDDDFADFANAYSPFSPQDDDIGYNFAFEMGLI